MSMSLTHKQAELLAFLKRYVADHDGAAPSFDEMKDAIGQVGKAGIHRLLTGLEERGKIARTKRRARCIRILADNGLDGIPSSILIDELTRRGVFAPEARQAA